MARLRYAVLISDGEAFCFTRRISYRLQRLILQGGVSIAKEALIEALNRPAPAPGILAEEAEPALDGKRRLSSGENREFAAEERFRVSDIGNWRE